MPRDHARIQTARSNDEDWRGLSLEAQWTYDAITTSEGLTYAGVIDFRPGRIAALAKNRTANLFIVSLHCLWRAASDS